MMAVTWVLLTILRTITWAPHHKEADQLLIETQDQMSTLWNMDGGSKEHKDALPPVDFSKESLVAVFAGFKPTLGYGISIKKIEYSKESKTLRVMYALTAPANGIGEEQISYPYCIAVIEKCGVVKTEFIDQDSPEGKELEKGAAK